VIVLGVILLIIGAVVGLPILWTVGVIVALVGLVLWALGRSGHQVGRRSHYY